MIKKKIKLKMITESQLDEFCKRYDVQLKTKVKHCVKCPFLTKENDYCIARTVLYHKNDVIEVEVNNLVRIN